MTMDSSTHEMYDESGLDWNIELMDGLLTTYGWLFKPLEPFDAFQNMSAFGEKDVARLDFCNEMLLEYLEDHADEYDHVEEISDRAMVVYASGKLSSREGTTRQNIYQWMAAHVRLKFAGEHLNNEWIHIDEHQEQLSEATQEGWKEGFADAHDRLSDD